jgi:hypothetical protein
MTKRNNDIKARLLAVFREEAQEHLQVITTNLLALERELPPAETHQVAEATFREVHTLIDTVKHYRRARRRNGGSKATLALQIPKAEEALWSLEIQWMELLGQLSKVGR